MGEHFKQHAPMVLWIVLMAKSKILQEHHARKDVCLAIPISAVTKIIPAQGSLEKCVKMAVVR